MKEETEARGSHFFMLKHPLVVELRVEPVGDKFLMAAVRIVEKASLSHCFSFFLALHFILVLYCFTVQHGNCQPSVAV